MWLREFMEKTSSAPQPRRRERKRQQTRDTIMRAAYALFMSRGYKNVTINDIATAADVDPTTFWRHFGSKEAVLFADPLQILDRLETEIAGRPPEETVFDATINAVQVLVGEIDQDPSLTHARITIAETAPEVQQLAASIEHRGVLTLAHGIAKRMGTSLEVDGRPYVLSSMVLAAVRWIRSHPNRGSFPTTEEVFRQVYQLAGSMADLGVPREFPEGGSPKDPKLH
jgi:AcrR family transcriptional regulator